MGLKTIESSSSWEQVLFGLPQGLVLRAIFSTYFSVINSSHFPFSLIFFILNDIDFSSYADDNTLYNACNNEKLLK